MINKLKIKMIQKMISLITMDLSTNSRDMEISLKSEPDKSTATNLLTEMYLMINKSKIKMIQKMISLITTDS